MHITIRRGEDLLKIFDNNRYVGYVDRKDDLYGFSKTDRAVLIQKNVNQQKIVVAFRAWYTNHFKATDKEIIESLVKRLTIYEPDSTALKSAREHLQGMKK